MKNLWLLPSILIILLSAMIFCIFNVQKIEEAKHNAANAYFSNSAGVVLLGGAGADKSWIENTNDHPTIIKHIHQNPRYGGEMTLEIFMLNPSEKKEIKVQDLDGFIIIQVVREWNLEVGFISASPRILEVAFDAK